MHWAAVIAIWCLTLQRMKNYLATVTVIKSASTKTKMTTEGNCQQETDWLPVAGMTAQSKEIVVKTLDRLLLQHVVDSVATVQLADQILFIERRLCYRRHCTVHIRHFTPSCEVVCFVARCVWMFVNTIAWTILGVTVKSVWVYGQNMVKSSDQFEDGCILIHCGKQVVTYQHRATFYCCWWGKYEFSCIIRTRLGRTSPNACIAYTRLNCYIEGSRCVVQ